MKIALQVIFVSFAIVKAQVASNHEAVNICAFNCSSGIPHKTELKELTDKCPSEGETVTLRLKELLEHHLFDESCNEVRISNSA